MLSLRDINFLKSVSDETALINRRNVRLAAHLRGYVRVLDAGKEEMASVDDVNLAKFLKLTPRGKKFVENRK